MGIETGSPFTGGILEVGLSSFLTALRALEFNALQNEMIMLATGSVKSSWMCKSKVT